MSKMGFEARDKFLCLMGLNLEKGIKADGQTKLGKNLEIVGYLWIKAERLNTKNPCEPFFFKFPNFIVFSQVPMSMIADTFEGNSFAIETLVMNKIP